MPSSSRGRGRVYTAERESVRKDARRDLPEGIGSSVSQKTVVDRANEIHREQKEDHGRQKGVNDRQDDPRPFIAFPELLKCRISFAFVGVGALP